MQQAVAVIQRSFTPHILPAGILPFANTLISFFRFLWSFCCPAPGNRIITVAARVRVINPVELRYITAEDVLKFSYLPPVMLKPSIFLFVHGITTIWRNTTLRAALFFSLVNPLGSLRNIRSAWRSKQHDETNKTLWIFTTQHFHKL